MFYRILSIVFSMIMVLSGCAGQLSDKKNIQIKVSETADINKDTSFQRTPKQSSEGIFIIDSTVPLDTGRKTSTAETSTIIQKYDSVNMNPESVQLPAIDQVTLYTYKKTFDHPFLSFIHEYPFFPSQNDSISRARRDSNTLLMCVVQSPEKVKITCTGNLVNKNGKSVTGMDIIRAWTDFIKENPAQGNALFNHVRGVKKFIRNEEAIVQGFILSSKNEITITFDAPQQNPMDLLDSYFLLPASLGIGKYTVANQDSTTCILVKNEYFPFSRQPVNRYVIYLGNDLNPIVSFSLHKYDIALLYKKKDLEYCRKNLAANAQLFPADTVRYFLSSTLPSAEMRAYIKSKINQYDILKNVVRAEGEVISSLQNEVPIDSLTSKMSPLPPLSKAKPFIILYQAEDPISSSVADKLFSILSNNGFNSSLKGLSQQKFESALFNREYDIAIGSTKNSVLYDKTEQIRTANIWFNEEKNEALRIAQFYEIPLFSIHVYALCAREFEFLDKNFIKIIKKQ